VVTDQGRILGLEEKKREIGNVDFHAQATGCAPALVIPHMKRAKMKRKTRKHST
jgi:hypothetical protein